MIQVLCSQRIHFVHNWNCFALNIVFMKSVVSQKANIMTFKTERESRTEKLCSSLKQKATFCIVSGKFYLDFQNFVVLSFHICIEMHMKELFGRAD